MTLPTLQTEVIEALRSAGATEEIIAAAVKASGELRTPHSGVRPRPENVADPLRLKARPDCEPRRNGRDQHADARYCWHP